MSILGDSLLEVLSTGKNKVLTEPECVQVASELGAKLYSSIEQLRQDRVNAFAHCRDMHVD